MILLPIKILTRVPTISLFERSHVAPMVFLLVPYSLHACPDHYGGSSLPMSNHGHALNYGIAHKISHYFLFSFIFTSFDPTRLALFYILFLQFMMLFCLFI